MSEGIETIEEGVSVTRDGRKFSQEALERQRVGQAKGRQSLIEALALKNSMDTGQSVMSEVRSLCLAAMPKIMANMVRMASGENMKSGKPAPAVAQVAATKLVAGVAGIATDVQPGSGHGAIPLAEMGLGDLEGALSSMLDNVRTIRAIESTSQRIDSTEDVVPNTGTNAPEPDAAQAEVGAHSQLAEGQAPPAGGETTRSD